MTLAQIAGVVALVAGALLVVTVAAAHLMGREQRLAGLALGLLGVLLIGFPLFERFELGVGPEGGTLSGELRARTDLAATEATLVARLDTLEARLEGLAAGPPLVPEIAPVLPPAPGPDPGRETPADGGAADRGEGEEEGEAPPAPVITPLPGADRLALVFHRAARAADAEALVEALRGLGFAASAVPTDLSEARDAPEGAARVLWEPDHRAAAEAASEAAAALPGAGAAMLDDAASDLYRGEVQVQLF